MFLNKPKVKELMVIKTKNDKYPNGNYHEFARKLNVDVAQLHRILNRSINKAGPEFLGKFMKYCQDEGLDFNEYIFLESSLHAGNEQAAAKESA